jgi:uncharacterized protein (DUF362 family)
VDPGGRGRTHPLGASVAPDVAAELVAEVTSLLDECAERYPTRPDLQLRRILLLALEREQTVTVAYRDTVLAARLDTLPIPADVRRLMRHCLAWAWKDEGLHADYLRGWLLRTGHPEPAAVIFAHQLEGAISGWVTAVRQHDHMVEAPTRTAAATVLLAGARLVGRIPPLLARELRTTSFKRYLLLNVALERTAEIGYERAVVLAESDAEREVFDRIRADENSHCRAFRLLAEALDDDDFLAPGASAERLATDLAEVSKFFVPGELRRSGSARPSALGSGAAVWVHRGTSHDQLEEVLTRTLDDAGLGGLIESRKGEEAVTVAIRASFMFGYHRDDRSNITDPAVIEGIASYLRRHGATDVAVVEAPTVYGGYFGGRSVAEVAEYFGFRSDLYRVVDASSDQTPCSYERGLGQHTISRTWQDADIRIVVPKLRTNPAELAHLSLSSLDGTGGREADTVYPDRQIHYRNAAMLVLDQAPPDFSVIDAWGPVGDGPFGVMGCADPAIDRRVYAGADILAVDAAVLADLGVDDPRRSPIVRTACQWFGVEIHPDVHGEPGPFSTDLRRPWDSAWFRLASALSYPIYTYASRHGRLFVPAMDTEAFPELEPPGHFTRAVRAAAQAIFGLHPPAE